MLTECCEEFPTVTMLISPAHNKQLKVSPGDGKPELVVEQTRLLLICTHHQELGDWVGGRLRQPELRVQEEGFNKVQPPGK